MVNWEMWVNILIDLLECVIDIRAISKEIIGVCVFDGFSLFLEFAFFLTFEKKTTFHLREFRLLLHFLIGGVFELI